MVKKSAVILAGHGSLRSDSGRAMLQIAERLREQGVAPVVEAGFLNYSQPTLAEAAAGCVAQGATSVIVQPYFLIEGHYVRHDLPQAVRTIATEHAGVRFTIAEVLGYHPALAKLAQQRLAAVDPTPNGHTNLLFVAHGTPLPEANAPIRQVLRRVQQTLGYQQAQVAYLDCNQPDIPTAIDQALATAGAALTILPYFLHLGRHVREDLPALFAAARERHPYATIRVAHHLDYDRHLVEVTAERIMASMMC
ncbi:MAG: sirohydrochlorin chelatase [Caldilineaceae bacterium]